MCGIVGYLGYREAMPVLINGLHRLEYRGYDSAGIAIIQSGQIAVRRQTGKLANLDHCLAASPVQGTIGIGHTRWATHGRPAEHNAHPHLSMNNQFVVVHNGIVENYQELRASLMRDGFAFRSETDTEVIVHLIERFAANGADMDNDITEATRSAVALLKGAQALVVMSLQQPDRLVAVRLGNAGGLAVGLGQGERFLASDIPAILDHTRDLIFLEHRQMVTLTADDHTIETLDAQPVRPIVHSITWDTLSASKGEYRHFMQKEIFEQPRSLTDTLRGRVDFENGRVMLPELNLSTETARGIKRIVTVACGTSYYSGLVGKFLLERLARLYVEVDYASEYRYRECMNNDTTAVLAITQSGETVDTLAAMEQARHQQTALWSIVNAIGSQAMRMADGHVTMNAGPEIGVASTKAFTASIVAQYLLALYLAQLRQTLPPEQIAGYVSDLTYLPGLVSQALELEPSIREIAAWLKDYQNVLYLGRGIQYPVALEGALKLKEISYIHAEGYPAGEMKHGPIALIDANMPVIAIALKDDLYDKMVSQIEQAKARGASVIVLATEGDRAIAGKVDHILYLPETPALLSPVVSVIPLQLLAYHVALCRGTDVDQPRNLAKSVTVE